MKPMCLVALGVLNDLKTATQALLEKKRKTPALLLVHAGIDICAWLSDPGTTKPKPEPGDVYCGYLETFVPHRLTQSEHHTQKPWRTVTAKDLWASRSSLLHMMSPFGRDTAKKKARPIFFHSWPETEEQAVDRLRRDGHQDFVLMTYTGLAALANFAYMAWMSKVESDPSFEAIVEKNAERLYLDEHTMKLRDFYRYADGG